MADEGGIDIVEIGDLVFKRGSVWGERKLGKKAKEIFWQRVDLE